MEPIRIIINQGVYYKNLPQKAKKKIIDDLSFDNPAYVNAKKYGKNISSLTMPTIPFFEASKKTYWTPRGYIYFFIKFCKENNYKYIIEDRTLSFPALRIKFYGILRDYQKPAVRDMLKYPVGVLEAPTGGGKTAMAIYLIAARKQPTLIIVHNKELLYQWENAIKTFLHYQCGMIGDGNKKIKKVTVGIINSVNNNMGTLYNQFGMVLIDEVHRVSSSIFTETVQEFTAKYFYGFTATSYRSDGLGKGIFACIGPKLYTVDRHHLNKIKATLKPRILRITTDFYTFYKGDYAETITELVRDTERNNLICTLAQRDFKKYNQSILIVSDRKEHCSTLQKNLLVHSLMLTSKTKKKERKEIIRKMRSGECKVLISTTSLIGEGFDLDVLNALFLTTPIKFSGRLIQICGRILRPNKGAQPRVYDFRDMGIGVLRNSGFVRDLIYKKLKW